MQNLLECQETFFFPQALIKMKSVTLQKNLQHITYQA